MSVFLRKAEISITSKRYSFCGVITSYRLALVAVLFLLIFCAVKPSFAFWPPLQDVQAWIETSNSQYRVVYTVYDPKLGSWVQDDWGWFSSGDIRSVGSLTVADGIVAWRAMYRHSYETEMKYNIFYRVYDPALGRWKEGEWGWFSSGDIRSAGSLTVADGVVAWRAMYRYSYETEMKYNVLYNIYDPSRGSWRDGQWGWYEYYPGSLSITNATVTWIANSQNYTRGYNPNNGSWYSGTTKPLAYFHASPTSGNPPLWVWFTDMSIGGTSWWWNFGDGGESSARSPSYTFNNIGVFTVTQTVTGPYENDSTSITIITDTVAPTGSITINGGASYTNSTSVSLSISASDPSGVSQMCISNTVSCSSWETYTTTKPWTLLSGDGEKTVYVWFKDNAGNTNSTPYNDSIVLDTTAPTDGTLSAIAGNAQVLLSWSGFIDTLSGINSYNLVYSTDSIPVSCSTGTQIYSGSGTSYTHTGLTNGMTYYYRVCAVDNANNMSTGAADSATPYVPVYLEVCASGCTYSTIQGAIDASGPGNTIKVEQGTYNENILISTSKEFTLHGGWDNTFTTMSNDPSLTVIDGDTTGDGIGDGSVITVYAGTGVTVTAGIENFTISTGNATDGGGVYIYSEDSGNVQLTLLNNIIEQNEGVNGGGLSVNASNSGMVALILTNNMIVDNTSDKGGGIYADTSGTGSTVDLIMTNDTITANNSNYGGGLYLASSSSGATAVTGLNEIIWGSTAIVSGDDIYLYKDSSTTTVSTTYSDIGTVVNDPVYPGTYTGDITDISADPVFVNPVTGDYHLQPGSPCIDTGTDTGAPLTDFEGDTRPYDGDGDTVAMTDMGADEYVGTPMTDPAPDIKANGSDGPITITTSDTLSLTVNLDSGSHAGENVDGWLLANTPFGLYHYDLLSGWQPGVAITYQGPLFDFSPYEVLNMSGLPVGTYTCYFGVDMNMNGSINMGQMYYDSVEVTITLTP